MKRIIKPTIEIEVPSGNYCSKRRLDDRCRCAYQQIRNYENITTLCLVYPSLHNPRKPMVLEEDDVGVLRCAQCKADEEGTMTEIKIREPLMWFAGRIESKLRKRDTVNDDGEDGPRGWIGCSKSWLISRARDEMEEALEKASEIGWRAFGGFPVDDEEVEAFVDECADAAAFWMFLADNARSRRGR